MSARGKKYSQTENSEQKVVETQRVVVRLKDSQQHFENLVRTVQRYVNEYQKVMVQDKAFTEAVVKLSLDPAVGEDIVAGLRAISNCSKSLGEQRGEMLHAMTRNIMEGYLSGSVGSKTTRLNAEKGKVITFIKEYKDLRATSLKNVKKAENKYAKASKPRAAKKKPDIADQAGKALKETIDSHNVFLGDELRSIALVERKKYLTLIKYMSAMLKQQADAYQSSLAAIVKCQEAIEPLIPQEDERYLPQELLDMIKAGPCVVDKKTGGLASSSSDKYAGKYDINASDDEDSPKRSKLSASDAGVATASGNPVSSGAAPALLDQSDGYLSAMAYSAGTLRKKPEQLSDSDSDDSDDDSDDDSEDEDRVKSPGEASVDDLLRSLKANDTFSTLY